MITKPEPKGVKGTRMCAKAVHSRREAVYGTNSNFETFFSLPANHMMEIQGFRGKSERAAMTLKEQI